jgi:DNA polymerase III subunit delta'
VPIVPLYGHEALLDRFVDRIRAGALPASLLLHGPRGVGKQRLALRVAQALLCEADDTPCGRCQQCRFTGELSHPDLHWFFPRPRLKDTDASTADVVDDFAGAIADRVKAGGLYAPPPGSDALYISTVRAIVQQASLSPAIARRKIFVIGDAERMVPQEGSEFAANALLKLLEEPPANTTLLLTSSEPGALLPTIRSRVVAVRVPPLPAEAVRRFIADPLVAAALERAGGTARRDLVAEAGGAPGRLLGGGEERDAGEAARRLIAAAEGRDRQAVLRLLLGQGGSRARGAYSDMLDALTVQLHARARSAVDRGDAGAAWGASRAVAAVEEAKEMAAGNVNPQLITSSLMRTLAEAFR